MGIHGGVVAGSGSGMGIVSGGERSGDRTVAGAGVIEAGGGQKQGVESLAKEKPNKGGTRM